MKYRILRVTYYGGYKAKITYYKYWRSMIKARKIFYKSSNGGTKYAVICEKKNWFGIWNEIDN